MLPLGFRFSGVHCGIKKNPQKEDFTLIHCPQGAVAAGVYTQNLVFAAPVALDRERTPSHDIRVVAVNSGNANACTGERGMKDAREMARLAAAACGAEEQQTLVMSTGIIGVFLPMEKIAAGAKAAAAKLGSDEDSFLAAARGITTTDKAHKVARREIITGGKTIHIAGMCKGAGMIGPNMATMLAVVVTDAALTPAVAQRVLKNAADESFNCISVEGHMSTNDTMLLLASGAASSSPLTGDDLTAFQTVLTATSIELCKQIPDDGEGASHLICITIEGCKSRAAARQIAQSAATPQRGRCGSASGSSRRA